MSDVQFVLSTRQIKMVAVCRAFILCAIIAGLGLVCVEGERVPRLGRSRALKQLRQGRRQDRPRPLRDRPEGFGNRPLYLGDTSGNYTRADCMWRRDITCPSQDINFYLYSSETPSKRQWVNINEADWLRLSAWNPHHDNILLIHGYAGKDGAMPTVVVRDAYLKNGSYNVFVMDWGPIAKPPCYPAIVHNIKEVARCGAQVFAFLRHSGMRSERTTCVGHSLGAHLCGLMSLTLHFRMHRIIALDPARPLLRNQNKLNSGDAEVVQIIHTNADGYGEGGRLGTVDFCVNGGRMQPYCENRTNPGLCSHIRSACYLAESINTETARMTTPCSRRCPAGTRLPNSHLGAPVIMGEHTPDSAFGIYCVSNTDEPYCPTSATATGDMRCCNDPGNAAPGLPLQDFKEGDILATTFSDEIQS